MQVNLELPDDIYRRLQGMAAITHQSLQEVLVRTLRGNLPPTLEDLPSGQCDLVSALEPQSDEALWSIAKEPLPAQDWQRHQRLLHKAEQGRLTQIEQTQLAELRTATDQFVLRRSIALALLKWRGTNAVSRQR